MTLSNMLDCFTETELTGLATGLRLTIPGGKDKATLIGQPRAGLHKSH